jgi:hypothetical protein
MFVVLCAPYLVCVYTGLPGSHPLYRLGRLDAAFDGVVNFLELR